MPPVGAAIAASWTAFTATSVGAFVTGNIVGRLLVTVAVSALMRSTIKMPRYGDPGIETKVTQTGAGNPLNLPLGKTSTAGVRISPPVSWGNKNTYGTFVMALSAAPGIAITRIAINGEWVPLVANADTTRPTATWALGGDWAGYGWVYFFDGSQTEASAFLIETFADHPDYPWSAGMVGAGMCYAVVELRYNRALYPTADPRFVFETTGIPLYDPRADSSVGGDGAQRWDDRSTWAPSDNPIVQAYNIARGIALWTGDVWGGDYDAGSLPLANWMAAMNACDLDLDGAPTWIAGYEARVSQKPKEVIEELLKACAADATDAGGELLVRVGGPGLPVLFITDDDWLVTQDQTETPFPSTTATYNGARAAYPEPASLYSAEDAPSLINAEYEAADDNQRRLADLRYAAVPNGEQVQRLMWSLVEDNRRFRRHAGVLQGAGVLLDPMDCIAWTSERYGYDAKVFEVAEVTEDLRQCRARLSLLERDHDDWIVPPDAVHPINPINPGSGADGFNARGGDGAQFSELGGVDDGPDGTDNTAAFNAAVEWLAANGGGKLTLGPGDFGLGYWFAGPLRVRATMAQGCVLVDGNVQVEFAAPVWFGAGAHLRFEGVLVEEQALDGPNTYAQIRATSGAGTAYPRRIWLSDSAASLASNFSVGDYIVIRGQEDEWDVAIERDEAIVTAVSVGDNYIEVDRDLIYTYEPDWPDSAKPGGGDVTTVGRYVASMLAADAAEGDTSITVLDGAKFQSGDWVHLEDTQYSQRYDEDTGLSDTTNVQHEQGMQIDHVDGNTIHLTEPLIHDLFTAQSALCILYAPVLGGGLTGGTIRFTAAPEIARYTVWLHYAVGCTISDLRILTQPGQTDAGLLQQGIRIGQGSVRNTVDAVRIEHAIDSSGGYGYGVIALKGARSNTISRCFCSGLRHSFIEMTGAANNLWIGNVSENCGASDFDVHNAAESGSVFSANIARFGPFLAEGQSVKAAFKIGNPSHIGGHKKITCIGNVVDGFVDPHVAFDVIPPSFDVVIKANVIRNCGTAFRVLYNARADANGEVEPTKSMIQGLPIERLSIIDNDVHHCARALYCDGGPLKSVRGLRFRRNTVHDATTDDFMIYARHVDGVIMGDNDLLGLTVGIEEDVVYLRDIDGLRMTDTTFEGGSKLIRLTDCPGALVERLTAYDLDPSAWCVLDGGGNDDMVVSDIRVPGGTPRFYTSGTPSPGRMIAASIAAGAPMLAPEFEIATLPDPVAGGLIYVTDETGGAVLAWCDGATWRRVTDGAAVS
ncbi:Host specificity protein J [Rhodovulum sp. P5]|uniref:phage tail protein n=1 Tax=Rhodovulum sp. P5 TaxID=1564506 RepID=UPI0009C238C1|nr:phage tail protein [Rhodovulum sp. P5]ARE40920.1 Host specificity protein J [Rhodovulum sp. P5]